MTDSLLTGGCTCGGVRFEIAGSLLSAGYCHCTRCQRRTGTGSSANATVAPGALRVTAGGELVRVWAAADGKAKAFCSACGGHVWSEDPHDPDEKSVRLGALDGDPGVPLSYRQYVAYAAPWDPIPDDGLPRYDERRPPGV